MRKSILRNPVSIIVLLGLVSLFADMTYESARSINGPFLKVLGQNAATVGWVAGLGELIGFGIRYFAGRLTDKTRRYWLIIFSGYAINLISIPLLAFVGQWEMAVMLMILERFGKAVRSPARDAVLSYASHQTGRGWGFALHEAMDQIGATAGPLLLVWALYSRTNDYHFAYGLLAIPAFVALLILALTMLKFPHPRELEPAGKPAPFRSRFPRRFWLYTLAIGFIAAAFADFPLIAFHLKSQGIIRDEYIPAIYSLAMFTDAIMALLMGKLYDRWGTRVLIPVFILQLGFVPLAFFGNLSWVVVAMILWGTGMAAQESIVKAEVAATTDVTRRGEAFGTFNAVFGLFWFAGSVVMGYLYEFSIPNLVIFSMSLQLLGLAVLLYLIFRSHR